MPQAPLSENLSGPEKLAAIFQVCSWPSQYHANTQWILEVLRPSKVVEVGVAYGFHADLMLSSSNCEYLGIDPYFAGYDESDPFVTDVATFLRMKPQQALDELHELVTDYLSRKYGSRFSLLRGFSQEAALGVPKASIDLVYVDGDHQRDAVLGDLESWWPKVQPGGMLAGDDFDVWPGVKEAVVEFGVRIGIPPVLIRSMQSGVSTYAFVKPS